jgi:hypothetical protein
MGDDTPASAAGAASSRPTAACHWGTTQGSSAPSVAEQHDPEISVQTSTTDGARLSGSRPLDLDLSQRRCLQKGSGLVVIPTLLESGQMSQWLFTPQCFRGDPRAIGPKRRLERLAGSPVAVAGSPPQNLAPGYCRSPARWLPRCSSAR